MPCMSDGSEAMKYPTFVLAFEFDAEVPLWRPSWFKGDWAGKQTWRFAWIWFSVSYYPQNLGEMFNHVSRGETEWRNG